MTAHTSVVRQVFKAKELPDRLRTALATGDDVDVVVEATVAQSQRASSRRLTSFIGAGRGGFESREEADAFIATLREEW